MQQLMCDQSKSLAEAARILTERPVSGKRWRSLARRKTKRLRYTVFCGKLNVHELTD